MATIVFNPASTGGRTPLAQIPDEIKREVEELYEATYFEDGKPLDGPRPGNFLVTADGPNKADIMRWFALARDYAVQRPDGELTLRRSPTSKDARGENQAHVTLRTPEDAKSDNSKNPNAQK